MSEFIPWDSQPLDVWASKYAPGKFVDLDGRRTHYIEKGEGKPVLLLHGFFYDSYLWAANIVQTRSQESILEWLTKCSIYKVNPTNIKLLSFFGRRRSPLS